MCCEAPVGDRMWMCRWLRTLPLLSRVESLVWSGLVLI